MGNEAEGKELTFNVTTMTDSSAEWPDLHDASIDRISITWPGAITTVSLVTADVPELRIVATGTALLSCPQENPWGTSKHVYVNSSSRSRSERGRTRLEIETASGDVITIEAADIAVVGGRSTAGGAQ